MKDRINLERIIALLAVSRNFMEADPKLKENVREIDELIGELHCALLEESSTKSAKRDREIVQLVRLAVDILSMFF